MRIIPAIDIIDGKCVRLSKGDYSTKKIYNKNPLDVALAFEDHGLRYLHLVDLDGAKSDSIKNYKILEQLAKRTQLRIDFGGGIKSEEDAQRAFDYGAHQITIGSLALKDPITAFDILSHYGSDKILLGADCENKCIAISGWKEKTNVDIHDFIKDWKEKKIKYVICTDISKDGMLAGPSFNLYKEIFSQSDIQLIASGGVTSLDDIIELDKIGCEGAIIGKAIYEGHISLKELGQLC